MDSDGYFSIYRSTYNIRKIKQSKNPHYFERTGIKQVQPEIVDLIYKYFGGYRNIQKPNTKNGKPLYGIQLTNLKAHKFIKTIYPFLRLKKKQAKILLLLRQSLAKGKTHKQKTKWINPRWNKEIETIRYAISPVEIQKRENWRKQIKQLNDSRNDPFHTPIPY